MYKKLLLFLFLFPCMKSAAQDTLSLVFVGDAMAHQTQLNNAWDGKKYDFSPYYTYIKKEISGADLAVVNMETPLAGEPYSGYPCFSAPDVFATTLKDAGFDVFLLANNHCLDKGLRGLRRTLNVLDTLGIKYIGAYKDKEVLKRQYPRMMICKGFRIAMLNYTYGTNGFAVDSPYIVNPMNKQVIAADIEEAKRMDPDMIIANMHWGNEYQLLPSKEQKAWTEWLFGQGVGMVIGSHPHVVQPMEMRRDTVTGENRLVVYSLGNFVSNMSIPHTAGGALVKVVLTKENWRTRITSAHYSLLYTHREPKGEGKISFEVVPASAWSDMPEKDSVSDIYKLREYVKGVRALLDKHNVGVEEYKFE